MKIVNRPGTVSGLANPSASADSIPQTNLSAWWDISDLSTLFQDANGEVPVTADGDKVALVTDKSGNGNDASQADNVDRPTYKTDGTYHWLLFDGINEFMNIPVATSGAVGSDNTAAFAVQVTASGNRGFIGGTLDAGLNYNFANGLIRPCVKTTSGYIIASGSTNTEDTDRVVSMTWDRSAGQIIGRQNGTEEVDVSGTAADKAVPAEMWLGQSYSVAAIFSGRIYSGAVYNAELDADNINNLEIYMATKNGATF